MIVRVALALVALAAAGFLVVQERGARAADRITHAALAEPDPQRLAAAQKDLAAAEFWNPDTTAALNLAIAEARAGHNEQASRRILDVTRRDPQNAVAFQLLCSLGKRYDSGLAETACARARELSPPVGSLKRSSGRSTK